MQELPNLDTIDKIAQLIADSTFLPEEYQNNPANIKYAILMGHEFGLKPMQAVKNIRQHIQTDGELGQVYVATPVLLAIIRNSGVCEYIEEYFDSEKEVATCRCKRTDSQEVIERQFKVSDIPEGTYANYDFPMQHPDRYAQSKARSHALYDAFPDIVAGIEVADVVENISYPTSPSTEIPLEEFARD
ncbi:hypothetical protein KCM76_22860 [Zooshikella marina]|uniref:hypothetical protein n=1 Tax=Zooshikella ganghwensis TaxID=202772 RepID=UPI001BAFA131|nr:hypothetical protein [Zooshikella ganghwensis]MBU2708853.1 hypothetical protein [Zooshikella ganghwensis]